MQENFNFVPNLNIQDPCAHFYYHFHKNIAKYQIAFTEKYSDGLLGFLEKEHKTIIKGFYPPEYQEYCEKSLYSLDGMIIFVYACNQTQIHHFLNKFLKRKKENKKEDEDEELKLKIEVCSNDLEKIQKLKSDIARFEIDEEEKEKKKEISLLMQDKYNGIILKDLEIKNNKKTDIDLQYNKNLKEKHKIITEKMNKKDVSGIYLFYGETGTGKSSYIEHLTENIDKKFIFIPPQFVGPLTEPTFISILTKLTNSVIIIEDAEKAILSREKDGDSSIVSSLLNISDGILGSIFHIQIILTFNTKRENIDKALLRKGRLLAEHEFKKLTKEESNNLLKHLNKKYEVKEDTSLADIFNIDEENFYKEKEIRKIGFIQ